jgi:D-alanyl-D-alanine dipeptidase
MPTLLSILALLLVSSISRAEPANPPNVESPLLEHASRQLVVVRTLSWASSMGTLRRFSRADGEWKGVGNDVAVDVGRHGLAWGRGLQRPEKGPVKREHDGRSVAGVFPLGPAFGYDVAPRDPIHVPYRPIDASTYCVEEPTSKFYNQIVQEAAAPSVWERKSGMQRADGLFRWGIVVEQNEPDTRANAGSCIFLHIWRGPHVGTAGCIAMAEESVEAILRWLDATENPLLVVLPSFEYDRLKASWALPAWV